MKWFVNKLKSMSTQRGLIFWVGFLTVGMLGCASNRFQAANEQGVTARDLARADVASRTRSTVPAVPIAPAPQAVVSTPSGPLPTQIPVAGANDPLSVPAIPAPTGARSELDVAASINPHPTQTGARNRARLTQTPRPGAKGESLTPAIQGPEFAGRVVDNMNRPRPEVAIEIRDVQQDNRLVAYVASGADGTFRVRNLRAGGQYELVALTSSSGRRMKGSTLAVAPDPAVLIQVIPTSVGSVSQRPGYRVDEGPTGPQRYHRRLGIDRPQASTSSEPNRLPTQLLPSRPLVPSRSNDSNVTVRTNPAIRQTSGHVSDWGGSIPWSLGPNSVRHASKRTVLPEIPSRAAFSALGLERIPVTTPQGETVLLGEMKGTKLNMVFVSPDDSKAMEVIDQWLASEFHPQARRIIMVRDEGDAQKAQRAAQQWQSKLLTHAVDIYIQRAGGYDPVSNSLAISSHRPTWIYADRSGRIHAHAVGYRGLGALKS